MLLILYVLCVIICKFFRIKLLWLSSAVCHPVLTVAVLCCLSRCADCGCALLCVTLCWLFACRQSVEADDEPVLPLSMRRLLRVPTIRAPSRDKTPIEEHFEKYGSFELTTIEQETYEKYFYGTEHWNYFTQDEDLGPIILSLKQETINGRDQFRCDCRALGTPRSHAGAAGLGCSCLTLHYSPGIGAQKEMQLPNSTQHPWADTFSDWATIGFGLSSQA